MLTIFVRQIVLAFSCVAASALSDEISVEQTLSAVRASPGYVASVEAAARASATWVIDPCLDAKASLGDATVVDAPRRGGDGSVETGRWFENVAMDGCRTERQLNVAVEAAAIGLALRSTLPGSTRAPLPLQDALKERVVVAAGVDPGGCRPCYVLGADYDRRQRAEVSR